jgi:cyanate permease
MPTSSGRDGRSAGGLARLLCLLWLAGVAMRMTLLVMPPVIPQLHDELHMSETQVGLLIGLPLAILAVAAIPGSLLIARVGATLAVTSLRLAALPAPPPSMSGRCTPRQSCPDSASLSCNRACRR